MESELRRKLHILKKLLSPANFGPPKLVVALFFYSFSLFIISHFISLIHNGSYELSKERWIIICIFGISIESINQISYYLAKRSRKVAIKFKAVVFWLLFTISIVVYVYLLGSLKKDPNLSWKWSEQIGLMIVYLSLSLVLPFYSLSPDIRFLLLYGKYGGVWSIFNKNGNQVRPPIYDNGKQ